MVTDATSGASNASSISIFTPNQVRGSQRSKEQQSASGRPALISIASSAGGSLSHARRAEIFMADDLPDSDDDNDNSDADDDNDGVGSDDDSNGDDDDIEVGELNWGGVADLSPPLPGDGSGGSPDSPDGGGGQHTSLIEFIKGQ